MTKQLKQHTNKHIVFTWELGANYGHISKIHALSLLFVKKGYKVSFILKDLSHIRLLEFPKKVRVYQAPRLTITETNNKSVKNYSDVLLRVGYSSTQEIRVSLQKWGSLLSSIAADVVVCNHSPTAIIAAKIKGLPTVSFGTGFEVPSYVSPFESLLPWEVMSESLLKESDKQLFLTIEQALHEMKLSIFGNLQQLLMPNLSLLCCLPEIDPYLGRAQTPYWGPIIQTNHGAKPKWSQTNSYKILVYLRSGVAINQSLFSALSGLPCSVLVHYIGGYSVRSQCNDTDRDILFSEAPFKMSEVLKQVNLIICHAGHGMVSNAILNGIPLLLLPTQQEQKITTYRATRLAIAQELLPSDSTMKIRRKLKSFMQDEFYQENAMILKNKYQEFKMGEQLELMVEQIERVV